MDEKKITHPSFGFIRASRVSGRTRLFDSAMTHQHYVEIVIGHAEQARSFKGTHIYDRGEMMRVAMSEAQFAQFITSMNVGSGSPCTIRRFNKEMIEEPPADINTRKTFENEMKQDLAKMDETLQAATSAVQELVAKGKAGKADLQNVLGRLMKAHQDIRSNIPFAMDCINENIEKMIARAQMDINAHAVMMGQRFALTQDEDMPAPILLDENENGEEQDS